MDTSIFAVDVPMWLTQTSGVLFVADVCLGLLVIILVSCLIGQHVTHGHSVPKRTPVVH
jgi:hypothetical protein